MKYTAVRFTCFCVLFFLISARMAAAQEQQPSSTPATAAIAGATIAEWKGNIRLSLPGQLASNPFRGEQLPPGTILDTGSGSLLLRLNDGSEVIVRAHTRLERPEPGENEISGKSELEVEFERAEVDREVEIGETAEISEMTEVQEIAEQTTVAVEVDVKPGSEPQ